MGVNLRRGKIGTQNSCIFYVAVEEQQWLVTGLTALSLRVRLVEPYTFQVSPQIYANVFTFFRSIISYAPLALWHPGKGRISVESASKITKKSSSSLNFPCFRYTFHREPWYPIISGMITIFSIIIIRLHIPEFILMRFKSSFKRQGLLKTVLQAKEIQAKRDSGHPKPFQ